MLNKDSLLRPTARNILISIGQNFPHLQLTERAEKKINIFDSFSNIHFQDLAKLCEFETDSSLSEKSFELFFHCFRNQTDLETNTFYQISFHQAKILLSYYSLQSATDNFPLSWKIEILDRSSTWILIDQRNNVKEMNEIGKRKSFSFQREFECSSLRITFLLSIHPFEVFISSLDFYGTILGQEKKFQNRFLNPNDINIFSQ
jgi:hypothetical protein